MANVSLQSVKILNNPAYFEDDFEIEIEFNAVEKIEDDLEWKLIYVGSGKSSKYDQELDSILVGPIESGMNKFIFRTPGPSVELLPKDENLLGSAVILLSCSYKDQEFISIGYYITNALKSDKEEKSDEMAIEENEDNEEECIEDEIKEEIIPLEKIDISKVMRIVLTEQPRITHYEINWD